MSSGHYFRGGFAPRRGRGVTPQLFRQRDVVEPDLLVHPLGELLATFRQSDLDQTTESITKNVAIHNCKHVGSYSWVDTKAPNIMIPGKPPLWTPLKRARRLEQDSGEYFRDPNAARFADYPTEPDVQAVFKTDPDFPTSEVDIFGCGSTMGNLLRFVRSIDKPFRFSVEVVGNTVFFIRKENDPRELIEGIRGFGHTFPEAYTTWEGAVKGSQSHQRLVQYDFGGLNCIVRFECDGYITDKTQSASEKDGSVKSKPEPTVDALLDSFGKTAVAMNTQYSDAPLTIQAKGNAVSQDAIFDLKTRSSRAKRQIDMEDMYPVLWLKQIPNLILAYHDGGGLFEDIRVQKVKEGVRDWEKRHKAALQRLEVLLKKIIATSMQSDTKLLEVYSPSVDHLEIRKRHGEGSHALPPALSKKWAEAEDYPESPDSVADLYELQDSYEEKDFDYNSGGFGDSDNEDLDFTACSADDCGYCGKCSY